MKKGKIISYIVIPASLLGLGILFKDEIVDLEKRAENLIFREMSQISEQKRQKALDYLLAETDTLSLFIEPNKPLGVDEVFYSQNLSEDGVYPETLRNVYRDLYRNDNKTNSLKLEAGVVVKNYVPVQGSINDAIKRYVNTTGTKTKVFRVLGKDGTQQFRESHQGLLDRGLKPIRDPR